jgi:Zn-dependent protease with chaperone function
MGRTADLVHRLETRWTIAVGSLVAVVVIAVLFLRYGVPAMANTAAHVLPASLDRRIGGESLAVLDHSVFKTSGLTPQRQAELKALFARMTASLPAGHTYSLELRNSPKLGPNALALPSGIVIMTDQLVALVPHDADPAHSDANREGDEEIMAVLAHELGHVEGRHALRQLLVSAGVSIMATVIIGDVSSVASVVGAAPMLLQAKHSRDFEREADASARAWLHAHGIPKSRFDSMLCRLAAGAPRNASGFSYLATHPDVNERAKCIQKPAETAIR